MVTYVLNGEPHTAKNIAAAKKQITSFFDRHITAIAEGEIDLEDNIIGIREKESEPAVCLAVLHLEDTMCGYRGNKFCVEFLTKLGTIPGIGNRVETLVVDNNGENCVADENGVVIPLEKSDLWNVSRNLLSSWYKREPNKPIKAIFYGGNMGVGNVPVYIRKTIFKNSSATGKPVQEYDLLVGCDPDCCHSWLFDVPELSGIMPLC